MFARVCGYVARDRQAGRHTVARCGVRSGCGVLKAQFLGAWQEVHHAADVYCYCLAHSVMSSGQKQCWSHCGHTNMSVLGVCPAVSCRKAAKVCRQAHSQLHPQAACAQALLVSQCHPIRQLHLDTCTLAFKV